MYFREFLFYSALQRYWSIALRMYGLFLRKSLEKNSLQRCHDVGHAVKPQEDLQPRGLQQSEIL